MADGESRKLNTGDWLHILQFALFLGTLGMAWQQFLDVKSIMLDHSIKIDRVEHYLSSKDANYWKLSHEDQ